MRTQRTAWWIAGAAGLTLAVAACGGDENGAEGMMQDTMPSMETMPADSMMADSMMTRDSMMDTSSGM